MKLTIIGSGVMALALADGLKEKYTLEFVVRDLKKNENLAKNYKVYSLNNFNILDKNIILAVKPLALKNITNFLKGKAKSLYSILAGISIQELKNKIESENYIRVMPNISATFKLSSTLLTGDEQNRKIAEDIFSFIGDVFWLNSEKELNIGTIIAGSGPALLSLVAESMMDGLVINGLKREDAIKITNSLFKGFHPLLNNKHPAKIKDEVMSPAGVTGKAYSELEKGKVRSSFIESIRIASI